MAVAAAATPQHGGCIWVYDGYPALYLLTQSCLPSRWVFPGHLNTANEASKAAIGVDPVTEVRRILAAKPEVIIDDAPLYALANPSTPLVDSLRAEAAVVLKSVLRSEMIDLAE